MSDINFTITNLDLVRMFAAWAFFYAAPAALIIALAIFIVPSWRRKRWARRFGYGIAGAVAILGVMGAPGVMYEADRTFGPYFRRTELAEPRTVEGFSFPAGTKLQFNKNGELESGTFPGPTPMQELLLKGGFRIEHSPFAKPRIWAATLAQAAQIEGVPCGEGPFELPDEVSPQILKCRLAKDFDFLSYPLAAGRLVELYPARRPTRIEHGILRASLTLFDVEWPAGTAISLGSDADKLRHAAIGDSMARLCVPEGSTVTLGEIELHGAVEIISGGKQTSLWSDPAVIAEHCPDVGASGYLLQNGNRQINLEIQLTK
jgi:hypothetical protein